MDVILKADVKGLGKKGEKVFDYPTTDNGVVWETNNWYSCSEIAQPSETFIKSFESSNYA